MILAVDPGIRGCGCALFTNEGRLFKAAYVVSGIEKVVNPVAAAVTMSIAVARWADDWAVNQLAVEWPRVYASRLRSGSMHGEDPNDLLPLAAVDGAISSLFDVDTAFYAPSDWKGQMTKEACLERINNRITGEEMHAVARAVIEAGAKVHNLWDAVGIGLFHVGRFAKKRVIPS